MRTCASRERAHSGDPSTRSMDLVSLAQDRQRSVADADAGCVRFQRFVSRPSSGNPGASIRVMQSGFLMCWPAIHSSAWR